MTDVYPDLKMLERRLGLKNGERLKDVERLEIDGKFLRDLLTLFLSDFQLNERMYQTKHKLESELDWGEAETVSEHFAQIGYFEGLEALPRNFDEPWYLSTYPDCRAALREGRYQTAYEHYQSEGHRQGRAPNARSLDLMARWREILRDTATPHYIEVVSKGGDVRKATR